MKFLGLGAVGLAVFLSMMMVVDGPGDLAALLFLAFGAKPLVQGIGKGLVGDKEVLNQFNDARANLRERYQAL